MKTLAIFLVTLTIMLTGYYIGYTAHERERQHQINQNPDFENPVFIWNDDLEALPVDGTPIMLEFTSNDTIFIGAIEEPYK